MYHVFENPVNPDSTFFGNTGKYRFVDGKYATHDKVEIEDLKKFFKFSTTDKAAEVEDVKKPDTSKVVEIPKSWTIARIYEHADTLGIKVPDNIVKREDIKAYVEAHTSKE
jgi:hypothetical protein